MISGHEIHRINNVAARIVFGEGDTWERATGYYYAAYHPDCLDEANLPDVTEDDVQIDHPYCGAGEGFTHWYEECAHCGAPLGDSAGIQPEDEDEDE